MLLMLCRFILVIRMKSYDELKELKTFIERFEYLNLNGQVGSETFGFNRYLNQSFYNSKEWKQVRDKVIIRDSGCDLGVEGYEINSKPIVHHINTITIEQINNRDPIIFDPNNLITVSHETHNAIHYGDESICKSKEITNRKRGDTCLWKHI